MARMVVEKRKSPQSLFVSDFNDLNTRFPSGISQIIKSYGILLMFGLVLSNTYQWREFVDGDNLGWRIISDKLHKSLSRSISLFSGPHYVRFNLDIQ